VAAVAGTSPTTSVVTIAGASPKPLILHSTNPPNLPDSAFAELTPVSDYRGSADYRKAMAKVLAHRALAEASSS
jgi:CO/xanthine dehydrogenase FAD-binding subunit